MGFKTMYQILGEKVPGWRMPLSNFILDHTEIFKKKTKQVQRQYEQDSEF